jgi:hypothetical protein
MTAAADSCPLCRQVAIVAAWSSGPDWLAIQGCPCGGYFVWRPVWQVRMPQLTDLERQNLTFRVRSHRVKYREVWVSTADGTVDGVLVVESHRPTPLPQ